MPSANQTCPSCGSEKVTSIRLPRAGEPGELPATQAAFRCLKCDAQWTSEDRSRTAPG